MGRCARVLLTNPAQSRKEAEMFLGLILGFVAGVLATLAFNHFFPRKVDAASAKLAKKVTGKGGGT